MDDKLVIIILKKKKIINIEEPEPLEIVSPHKKYFGIWKELIL